MVNKAWWLRKSTADSVRREIEKDILADKPEEATGPIDRYIGMGAPRAILSRATGLLDTIGNKTPSALRAKAAGLLRERVVARVPALAAVAVIAEGTNVSANVAAHLPQVIGGGILGLGTPHPGLAAAAKDLVDTLMLDEHVAWYVATHAQEKDLYAFMAFYQNPLGATFVQAARGMLAKTTSVRSHAGSLFFYDLKELPADDEDSLEREEKVKRLLPLVGPPVCFKTKWEAMQNHLVRAYAHELSDEVLDHALTYYESNGAKRLVELLGTVEDKVAKIPWVERQIKTEGLRLHALYA